MTRRRGVPLKDRPVVSGGAPVAGRGTRHCWVRDAKEQGEWPGLVLEWRQQDAQWRALVVYLRLADNGPTTIQEWLSSSRLRPVAE